MNEELKESALNDNDLEQVTGGKHKNIKDKKGKKCETGLLLVSVLQRISSDKYLYRFT